MQQCADGSDEKLCNVTTTCAEDEFRCVTSPHCIPKEWKCDQETDCIDGSDEVGCSQSSEFCQTFYVYVRASVRVLI
jgi:hypothetical protein